MSTPETVPLYRRVRPANGNNAIVNVAFAIGFDQKVDDASLRKFVMLTEQFFDWGYTGSQVQSLNFEFRAGEQMAPLGVPQLAGHTYQRNQLAPGKGFSFREITIRDSELILVADRYTRWKHLWSEAIQIYQSVMNILSPSVRISTATLEYLDRFDLVAGQPRFPIEEVLAESPMIPANARTAVGDWHSNHGFVSDQPQCGFHRSVTNVNVMLTTPPETGSTALQIMCQQRYLLPLVVVEPSTRVNVVTDVFTHAHECSKALMNALLTESAKQLISLNEPSP